VSCDFGAVTADWGGATDKTLVASGRPSPGQNCAEVFVGKEKRKGLAHFDASMFECLSDWIEYCPT
jgi:hypothetical protein